MSDPNDTAIIVQHVRDVFEKKKPCHVNPIDLKKAVREAQIDLIRAAVDTNTDDENKDKIKHILTNIGVDAVHLEAEYRYDSSNIKTWNIF